MSDILQTLCSRLGQPLQSSCARLLLLIHAQPFPELATHINFGMSSTCHKLHVMNRVQFKKVGYKDNFWWKFSMAFSYSEPGQSWSWAITNGLAWPKQAWLGQAQLWAGPGTSLAEPKLDLVMIETTCHEHVWDGPCWAGTYSAQQKVVLMLNLQLVWFVVTT